MVVVLLDLPAHVARRASIAFFRPAQLAELGAALVLARRQRRAEDDGHHRRPARCVAHAEHCFAARRGCSDSSICLTRTRIPYWVEIGAYSCISLGTLFGGWRIVHTMGTRITKLRPVGGFCAETGGAFAILVATHFGIPVSTTHTITGAIVGVGATNRLSAVRWGVAGRIVWAWILTIPAAAIMAAVVVFRALASCSAVTAS